MDQTGLIWIWSSDQSDYLVVAALCDWVVAIEIIVEVECSMDFNTLARVLSGIIKLHIWLIIPITSKDDDLVSIQRNR